MKATGSIVAIGLVAFFVGCDAPAPSARPTATAVVGTSTAAPEAASAAVAPKARKTTPPAIAIGNLSSQINTLTRLVADKPRDVGMRRKLIALLSQRADLLGRVADLTEVTALGEQAVALSPNDATAYLLRAKTRAAVHRFADALEDLAEAGKRGASADDTEPVRASILVGLGQYDEAMPRIRAAREKHPTIMTLGVEAQLLGKMGKTTEADALFAQADQSFRNNTPLPLAWLYFQWGAMWDHAGDRAKAERFYRAAVERLPLYAHAVGHLAALIPPAEAVPLVEAVLASSDDPEYLAVMASLRRKLGQAEEADALLARAKEGYRVLLERHPQAYADHAGWFWLAVAGDPEAAIEVARLNLKTRPAPEAFELLVAALHAAGSKDEACEEAERGLAHPYPSPGLRRVAARALRACGREEAAQRASGG